MTALIVGTVSSLLPMLGVPLFAVGLMTILACVGQDP
jgi:hypothetical protein